MKKPSKEERHLGVDEDTKRFQQFAAANPDVKAGDGISRTDKNIPVQTLSQKLGDWYGEVVPKGGVRRDEVLVIAGASNAGKSQLSDVLLKKIFPDLTFNKATKKKDDLIHQFVAQYPQYKIEATDHEISAVAHGKDFTATMNVDLKARNKERRYWHSIEFQNSVENEFEIGPYAETPFEALTKHGMQRVQPK